MVIVVVDPGLRRDDVSDNHASYVMAALEAAIQGRKLDRVGKLL